MKINILCLTFENGFTIREVVYDSVRENKEKGVKIVWFGVSERGTQVKDDFTRRPIVNG